MPLDEDHYRTATDLSSAIGRAEISPADVLEAFLAAHADLDRGGPHLNSLIEVDPDAVPSSSGRLAGVPVVVKDNIDTAGPMATTAGSFALLGSAVAADAPLIARLRRSGAVVAGKANLSEWANFRSSTSTGGWSARGGLVKNPHALDRSVSGSSSGSAAAVAAGIAPLAIGTETDGSILAPAALCGIVGLKPTVGLIDGAGVIPIAHSQDTAGPMARTVRDSAILLDAMLGTVSTYESATVDASVRGLTVGVPAERFMPKHTVVKDLFRAVVDRVSNAGAVVVDDLELPGATELAERGYENDVLNYEFPLDLARYLSTRQGDGPRTLGEVIDFNKDHADVELQHFGQEIFLDAWENPPSEVTYRLSLEAARRCGRQDGIDHALRASRASCLMIPSYGPAWKSDLILGDRRTSSGFVGHLQVLAVAGYPGITIPMGTVEGLPVGLAIIGTARSESNLLRVAAAIEELLDLRLRPQFRQPQAG
jgi:amidase